MALLNKLCIRGIRSFGPNDEERITFSTPLTLFLGQNGCGKTTIIESLKYALTNDLPAGSDSGRGFVNDPKLSNKSTTKGYVKLKFKDSKGDSITVARFVEVAVLGGGKLRFKGMNQTIRWEDGKGRTEDIAGRCADIDVYCSQKLNVSKAIINNVIFCHQENSSWPLEEAKKLKEKFDDIFGSTEYNKCVEKLRKFIKEKRANVKVLHEQFEQKKMAKRNTEKLREFLNEKEIRLEEIQNAIEARKQEIEPFKKRLNEINELVDTIGATHQKLTGLETTLKGVEEQQESIKKHLIEEYEGTDEDLEDEISNFNKFQDVAKNEILENESKKQNFDTKIQEINQAMQKQQVAFGQLKQEESHHSKRCEELKALIEKSKVKFHVQTEDDEPIPDILYKLNTAFKGKETSFNRHREDIEKKEKQLQDAIDNARAKFAATKESHSSKTKLINETKTKIKEVKEKLSSLTIQSGQREAIEKRLKEAEEALAKKKTEFDEVNQMRELEELDVQINNKDQVQTRLEREHRILQENYVIQQKIDSEKNLIIEKTSEICHLKEKHEQDFEILFKQDIPQERFKESILNIQKREEERVKSITKNISNYEGKIASSKASVKHEADKLQHYKDELNRDKNKVASICKGKVFSAILNESYAKKEKLQKEKGAYRSAKTLFEQFITQFERETPCCPVCATDFSSKKSIVPNIINTLKKKIEDLPKKLNDTEILLKKEEDLFNKLQQLKPVSENIQMLEEAKIPLLEEELQQNEENLTEAKMELVSLKNDLTEPQNLVETCGRTVSDATLLDRLNQEIKKSEDLVTSLTRDLATVLSNRTFDETATELSKVKAELTNLRKQYKTKRDLFDDTKDGIHRLNSRVQFENERKMQVQKSLQQQQLLEMQISEHKKTITQLSEEEKALAQKETILETELREAEQNRNEEVQGNKKRLDVHRLDMEACKRLIDDVQKLHDIIQKYEKGDTKTRLENILRKLEECKSDITKLEQSKKNLMNAIEKKKEELASQESKLRSLNDNKDLRSSRMKSKDLKVKIRDLKTQIGHHNSKSICDERRRVIDQIDSIQSDVNRKIGEEDTITEMIRSTKSELNRKEHKEAILEYKKKYYELRVEELAINDLDVYTAALEKSILKFHKERMIQINMTIRELWRNIYKGNDIDYIEIQTDDDIGAGGSRKRSYSYKVVQVKKGTELEMRGRCSAGQKVLACLVIRMALAETFSANCGILALDEPTTNLDRDNIMSLSDALSRIITVREKQKSFQLLIITHDEEFLQTLTRDQSVSHYFRVQRNADGFSEIRKEVL